MDKLRAEKAILFHMVLLVEQTRFERVEMIKDSTREVIGEAEFIVKESAAQAADTA